MLTKQITSLDSDFFDAKHYFPFCLGQMCTVLEKTQGAEEPYSTFVNIKMLDLFRSACHTLSELFVQATVKPAGILLRLA